MAGWDPQLEYVDEAPMYDAPELMAKAPANVRRMYRLLNLVPGMKRSMRTVRFRFWGTSVPGPRARARHGGLSPAGRWWSRA